MSADRKSVPFYSAGLLVGSTRSGFRRTSTRLDFFNKTLPPC
jgi:hypothetical protein